MPSWRPLVRHRRRRPPDPAVDRPGHHSPGSVHQDHSRLGHRGQQRGLRADRAGKGPDRQARQRPPHHAQRLAAGDHCHRPGNRSAAGRCRADRDRLLLERGGFLGSSAAIQNHDYIVVQSLILIFATIFLTVNLIVGRGLTLSSTRASGTAEMANLRCRDHRADRPGQPWAVARRIPAPDAQPSGDRGLTCIAIFVFGAVFAPLIAPYGPTVGELSNSLQGPSLAHIMGTDLQGSTSSAAFSTAPGSA